MFKKTLTLCTLSVLSAVSFAVQAEPAHHVVVAPQCLVKNLTVDYKTLSTKEGMALIEVNDAGIEQLITARQNQKAPCGGFMDVTSEWKDQQVKNIAPKNIANSLLNAWLKPVKNPLSVRSSEYTVRYEGQVKQLIGQISGANIWANLTEFSNFENRYANGELGVKAADWIKTHVEKLAADNNRTDVTVYTVPTGGYKQPSVVAKIGDSTEPGVVVGGHMDTISFFSNRQPGADDDGSGSMTIFEAARVILSSGMHFKKPIYFIWYAAEEEGLVGSKYVVKDFQKKQIPVAAVAQFDMTGFRFKNDPTMWLLDDNVNKDLTSFLDTLIQTYVKQPVGHTTCGYGCSDHASWNRAGFTASAPFEAKFGQENKHIHSSEDTMDLLSQDHMENFAKLATAYAVELAEPVA